LGKHSNAFEELSRSQVRSGAEATKSSGFVRCISGIIELWQKRGRKAVGLQAGGTWSEMRKGFYKVRSNREVQTCRQEIIFGHVYRLGMAQNPPPDWWDFHVANTKGVSRIPGQYSGTTFCLTQRPNANLFNGLGPSSCTLELKYSNCPWSLSFLPVPTPEDMVVSGII
jgi:hypothetical protein